VLALLVLLGNSSSARAVGLLARWGGSSLVVATLADGGTTSKGYTLVGQLFGGNTNGVFYLTFNLNNQTQQVEGGVWVLSVVRGGRWIGSLVGIIQAGNVLTTPPPAPLSPIGSMSMNLTILAGMGEFTNSSGSGGVVGRVIVNNFLSSLTGGLFPYQIVFVDAIVGVNAVNLFAGFSFLGI
jgi:hypothetical protein